MAKNKPAEETVPGGQEATSTAVATPLSSQEADSLGLLLTKSSLVRSGGMDPAHIIIMGKLSERAKKNGQKTVEQKCSRCKKTYYTVEGGTLVGCHHCCQGRL